MTKKSLQEILNEEKKKRHEDGPFGIAECKHSIEFRMKYGKEDLFDLLRQYYYRANNEIFFNKAMLLACWEMINDLGGNG